MSLDVSRVRPVSVDSSTCPYSFLVPVLRLVWLGVGEPGCGAAGRLNKAELHLGLTKAFLRERIVGGRG